MMPNRSFPLSMVTPHQRVSLVEIAAGRKLTRRLTELGLTPGVEMQVLQAAGGPLLVAVRNTRLALGRGVAHKIRVQPLVERSFAPLNGQLAGEPA